MAQQANPIGIGQSEFFRTQLSAASKRVKITFPSIFESYAVERVSDMTNVRTTAQARNRGFVWCFRCGRMAPRVYSALRRQGVDRREAGLYDEYRFCTFRR